MATLKRLLLSLGACSEAVKWIEKRDLKTAWAECERGDWMLWLCGRMQGKKGWPTHQQIVLAACDCAELSLPIFEKKYPTDKRPRTALEIVRKWANGEASIDDVRSAAAAAHAAAYAAYAAAAAFAAANARSRAASDAADAYAAAYVAASAAYFAASAVAFAAAYAASAADAARTARLRECADICRAKLFIPKKS